MSRSFWECAIQKCRTWLLPCLLAMGLIVGGRGDAMAGSAAASWESRLVATTVGGGAAYSVVKLGPPVNFYSPYINAVGQVVFSTGDQGSTSQAYFYDGAKIQNLGTLGGSWAIPFGINDYGQVIGASGLAGGSAKASLRSPLRGVWNILCMLPNNLNKGIRQLSENATKTSVIGDGPSHAFLWTPTKGMVDLGTLGGQNSTSIDINNAGQVIGYADTSSVGQEAFIWSQADGMIDIGVSENAIPTPIAINNSGQVAGGMLVYKSSPPLHAFLWARSGGIVDLGALDTDNWASATSINNKGQVVGFSGTFGVSNRAFSWTQTDGMIDLGDAESPNFPFVNDLGQVVLGSSGGVVMWTPARGRVDLGTLGGNGACGNGINNRGQVVGSSYDAEQVARAFVWTQTGGMVDLNTLIFPIGTTLESAVAISDNGSILANATAAGTNTGLFLLIPNNNNSVAPLSESFSRRSPFQFLAPGALSKTRP